MEPHSALPLSSISASRTSKKGVTVMDAKGCKSNHKTSSLSFRAFSSQLLLSYPLIWCYFCFNLIPTTNSHRHDEPPQLLGEDCELWSQAAKVARWAARAQARGKRRAAEEAGKPWFWERLLWTEFGTCCTCSTHWSRCLSIIQLVLKVFFGYF